MSGNGKQQLCLLIRFSDAEAATKMAPSKGDWHTPMATDKMEVTNGVSLPQTALVLNDPAGR